MLQWLRGGWIQSLAASRAPSCPAPSWGVRHKRRRTVPETPRVCCRRQAALLHAGSGEEALNVPIALLVPVPVLSPVPSLSLCWFCGSRCCPWAAAVPGIQHPLGSRAAQASPQRAQPRVPSHQPSWPCCRLCWQSEGKCLWERLAHPILSRTSRSPASAALPQLGWPWQRRAVLLPPRHGAEEHPCTRLSSDHPGSPLSPSCGPYPGLRRVPPSARKRSEASE